MNKRRSIHVVPRDKGWAVQSSGESSRIHFQGTS
jgi:hypothetical protein